MAKIFNRVFLKIVFLEIDHYNSKGLNCPAVTGIVVASTPSPVIVTGILISFDLNSAETKDRRTCVVPFYRTRDPTVYFAPVAGFCTVFHVSFQNVSEQRQAYCRTGT